MPDSPGPGAGRPTNVTAESFTHSGPAGARVTLGQVRRPTIGTTPQSHLDGAPGLVSKAPVQFWFAFCAQLVQELRSATPSLLLSVHLMVTTMGDKVTFVPQLESRSPHTLTKLPVTMDAYGPPLLLHVWPVVTIGCR